MSKPYPVDKAFLFVLGFLSIRVEDCVRYVQESTIFLLIGFFC